MSDLKWISVLVIVLANFVLPSVQGEAEAEYEYDPDSASIVSPSF